MNSGADGQRRAAVAVRQAYADTFSAARQVKYLADCLVGEAAWLGEPDLLVRTDHRGVEPLSR